MTSTIKTICDKKRKIENLNNDGETKMIKTHETNNNSSSNCINGSIVNEGSSLSTKKKKKRKRKNNSSINGDGIIKKPRIEEETKVQVKELTDDVVESMTKKRKKKKKKSISSNGHNINDNIVNKSGEVATRLITVTQNKEALLVTEEKNKNPGIELDTGNLSNSKIGNDKPSTLPINKSRKKKCKKKKSKVVLKENDNGDNKINVDTTNIKKRKKKKKKKNKLKVEEIEENKPSIHENDKTSQDQTPSLNDSKKENDVSKNGNIQSSEEITNGKIDKKKKKKKKKKNSQNNNGESIVSEPLVANLNESITNGKINKKKKKKKKKNNKNNNEESIVNGPHVANLNENFKKSTEQITKSWNDNVAMKMDNEFELISQPFKCLYMPDFIQDSNFLEKVKQELMDIEVMKKDNDLYKFHQTPDLKSVKSYHITKLREFLYGDFRKWLTEVTKIPLNDTVAMGSSRYEYTDTLLCHDDELEGRRIAYILYLTPPWDVKDGGALDLFDTDKNGQPNNIVRSLLPKWNTLAFFEVSPVSFHQVHEVLSKDKLRLSINGWFHGPNIVRPPKFVEPPRLHLKPIHIDQDELYSWINPTYLDMEIQKSIRKKFKNDSEIELEAFISEEKYEELEAALQSSQLKWFKKGPPIKQCTKILHSKNRPDVIESFCKFLQSEAIFLILSQLTGLELHQLAPQDSDSESDEEEDKKKSPNPSMTLDVRKWNHGCYTLLKDEEPDNNVSALDATYFLHVSEEWSLKNGGFTSYIAKDEDEELLTVMPRSNSLALVYRDAETLRFTKYVNASVEDLGEENSVFYDFACTYKE